MTFAIPLSGASVPVRSSDDVEAAFDEIHSAPSTAPVRDSIAAAFAEGFKYYQYKASRAAAKCDPTRAAGDDLREYADEHGVIPGANETNASIRARMYQPTGIVTPDAIKDGINALISAVTPKSCLIFELGLDGMFVENGDAVGWSGSFIHAGSAITTPAGYPGASPEYPTRFDLPESAIPDSGVPRRFHVRLPSLAAADELFAFVDEGDNVDDICLFIDNGDNVDDACAFTFEDSLTEDELYAAVVGLVNSIKGQGISWSAYVDPAL